MHHVKITILFFLATVPVLAQHHNSNWVPRTASDTTIVRCWNDSLSRISFPPNSTGMGMMYPDSLFCRFERMPMDSLRQPFDSTFMGWHRLMIGSDSSHFGFMNYGMGSGPSFMMQFSKNMRCQFYWDSLATDSLHRHWQPTKMMGWNGSQWVMLSNVTFSGNTATVTTSQGYSALAITGQLTKTTGVSVSQDLPDKFVLDQNYPNPFNPSTIVSFSLPVAENTSLKIYNVLGSEIATLIDGVPLSAGTHTMKFDASRLSSGIYFYTLQAGSTSITRKMLLMK